MGVSRISALTVHNPDNDIRVEVLGQHKETGKWAGAINLYKDNCLHSTVISSQAVYDTQEAAIKEMQEVVDAIRAMTDKELFG